MDEKTSIRKKKNEKRDEKEKKDQQFGETRSGTPGSEDLENLGDNKGKEE